jgi:hypothetical protein
MQKMITFTDKLYMMIEEHPPLPSLELDEPILDIKKSKKKYLSDFSLKKQDIRLYFKKEQVNTVFSLIKRQIK